MDKTPRHNFTLRITDVEHEWLKKEGELSHRSPSNFVRYVLSLYRKEKDIKLTGLDW